MASAPSTPERVVHSSLPLLAELAAAGWARAVTAAPPRLRPLVVSTDEDLLDDLLRLLAAARGEEVAPADTGFFARVRSAFK